MFIKVINLKKDTYYSGSDEWSYKEVPTLINTANIAFVCEPEKEKGVCIMWFTSGSSMYIKGTLDSVAQILQSASAMDRKEE